MKKSITTPILSMIVVVLVVLFFFTWIQNHSQRETSQLYEKIELSVDRKSILTGDTILLSIDDDTILKWFKEKSQLCDESNITSSPSQTLFCENKNEFQRITQFKSIMVSPDAMTIGFTIESAVLSPDTVVGVLFRNVAGSGNVELLSSYYLGNEFLGFSPTGKYFVYKGGCWEMHCALYVKDTTTLEDMFDFIPKEADVRGNYEFVRWVSDDEIEYMLNGVVQKKVLE